MQNDAQIHQKIRQSRRDKASAGRIFPKAFNLYYRTFITTYYFYFVLEILVLKMNQVEAVLDPAPTLLDSNFVEPQNIFSFYSDRLDNTPPPLTLFMSECLLISRKFSPHQTTSSWSTENMWTNGKNRIGQN